MITQDYVKEREKTGSILKLDFPEKIEAAFQYYRQLYLIEENRKDKIEGRANLIMASSAIVMALVTVFFCIILYLAPNIPLILIMISWIGYFIIGIIIFRSMYCAISINKLKGYSEITQKISEISDITQRDIVIIRKSLAIDYCCLATKQIKLNEQREILLIDGQKLLRNAVIIFILLSLLFVIDVLLSDKIYMKYFPKIR